MFTEAFNKAVDHAMLYEVGGFWKLTPEVEAGLIGTKEQRRACGYVNDPDDAGGETKFGVAKNGNPDLDITNLTWDQAKEVYFKRYWLTGSCDKLPARIAVLHFDGCVNHGVGRANKFLQKAAGVTQDGVIGPKTISAISALNEFDVCKNICNSREHFYRNIVEDKPTQVKFLAGWLRRINEMRQFVCDPGHQF